MIYLAQEVEIARHQSVLTYLLQYGSATLNLYSGAIPSDPTEPPTGTLVCTSYTELNYPPTVDTTSTELVFLDAVVNVDETPTFARFLTANGLPVMDVVVGDLSSAAPLKYNVAEFYEGGVLKISSLFLREL